MSVIAIAAIGKNRELGTKGDLVWKLKADLTRFHAHTKGHPVIMGRKTWESLPVAHRPLKERTNIVVTRQDGYAAEGAIVCGTIEEALVAAQNAPSADAIYILGGGEIYAAALPFTDILDLTLVDASADADTFFPAYEDSFSETSSEGPLEENGVSFHYATFKRN